MASAGREIIPGDSPADPGLNAEHAGQHDPVHEPWRQLGRVVGLEGFVRGEDGKGERGEGAFSIVQKKDKKR